MRVLYFSTEATPLVKVGGLGDVAGELPPALRQLGIDIQVVLPRYPEIQTPLAPGGQSIEVTVSREGGQIQGRVLQTESRGVPLWLVEGDPVGRSGAIYTTPYQDAEKFIFTCLAALQAAEAQGWIPDLIHANDWGTAPAVLWLASHRLTKPVWQRVATIFSIHNLAYMGQGAQEALQAYELSPPENIDLPTWAADLPMARALVAADWLTTVSPTYAEEIQTAAFGLGLDGVLRKRSGRLRGILNGLDYAHWNPEQDPALSVPYSRATLEKRAANKLELQRSLGLKTNADIPLMGMVTRLDHQKGLDLAIDTMERILDRDWQFTLLGTGDPALEARLRTFRDAHPARVHIDLRFDSELARRFYAGCDLLLIPSRYEPCGLAQLIALRYGCVPLVRSTGGLQDTVRAQKAGSDGTGFVFETEQVDAFVSTLLDAFELFDNPSAWRELQLRGMAQDFSWDRSAHRYMDLYHEAEAEALSGGEHS